MTELPTITFDNSYAQKLEGFYVPWAGSVAPAPRVLRLNRALAADLGLDADALAAVSNASTVLMIFLFISGGMELGGGLLVAAGKPTATKHEMTELL